MIKETEFTVFCMESYKVYKSLSGKQVYDLFRQYDVFDYIREFYDVLHTTSCLLYTSNRTESSIMSRPVAVPSDAAIVCRP